MEMQEVRSSQIRSIGYSPETQTLRIQFLDYESKSAGKIPGGLYDYFKVPPEAYAALMAADSIGQHFCKHIKGKYEFKRVPTL